MNVNYPNSKNSNTSTVCKASTQGHFGFVQIEGKSVNNQVRWSGSFTIIKHEK